jgi:hypothetical protein
MVLITMLKNLSVGTQMAIVQILRHHQTHMKRSRSSLQSDLRLKRYTA